jgi:hypothetical protein
MILLYNVEDLIQSWDEFIQYCVSVLEFVIILGKAEHISLQERHKMIRTLASLI